MKKIRVVIKKSGPDMSEVHVQQAIPSKGKMIRGSLRRLKRIKKSEVTCI